MRLQTLISAGILSSILLLNGCTPEEQALASGLAIGAVGGAAIASSYDHPYYYDRPYYYYHGHYYYGGRYHNGCYYHNGHRYHGGHYYHNGYRYYNGRRYRARVGEYGYYRNRTEYDRYRHQSNYNRHRYSYQNNYRNRRYDTVSTTRVGNRVYTPSSRTRGGWN